MILTPLVALPWDLMLEEFCFINKKVEVIGQVFSDAGEPSYVQQVMAPHIKNIESITLAPGETPYKNVPREIPPLPIIDNIEKLKKWENRWARLPGTLLEVKVREDEDIWADARLQLSDKTMVVIEWVPYSRWFPFAGKEVTVTLRIGIEKEEDGVTFISGGRTDIREGK